MSTYADGNTLTGGGRTNTWDSQNRMTSCTFNGTTSTFTYGADGLRRQATVNGVTTDYVYDGQTLIREGFASGRTLSTVKATYLQGPRGTECRIDETNQTEGYYRFDASSTVIKNAQGQPQVFGRGVTKWYVYDGLGSVVGEVDPSGNLTSSPKYDVYGLVRSNPGAASSAMGFVGGLGHLSEAGTGLIYMKARYYDPALGRFASEDGSKNGMNWFVYCNDNPTNAVDPSGKSALLLLELLIGVFGDAVLTALYDKHVITTGVFIAGMIIGAALIVAGAVGEWSEISTNAKEKSYAQPSPYFFSIMATLIPALKQQGTYEGAVAGHMLEIEVGVMENDA